MQHWVAKIQRLQKIRLYGKDSIPLHKFKKKPFKNFDFIMSYRKSSVNIGFRKFMEKKIN